MSTGQIKQAAQGETGASGTNGTNGVSVPVGGTTGQVLAKVDGTDYNMQWVDAAASGPAIVQSGFSSDGTGVVTLGAAPTQGNLLVAFIGSNSLSSPSSGWAAVNEASSGTDYGIIAFKVAGASELAAQAPVGAAAGCVALYELSNAAPGLNSLVHITSNSVEVDVVTAKAGGVVIGAFEREAGTDLPTGITGATADGTATGNSRSVAGFHISPATAATNAIVAAYAASGETHGMAMAVN